MTSKHPREPKNGAESVLLGLKRAGVDYLFANAGTDFPPVIEALAALPADEIPEPVTVPHETASVAMAHGYYLVTGKAQAVMVHVNVGLANAAMGVINAASDNIPVLVMSGRTPITETGRMGSRATPIQYGQEQYDQASLIRDVTKFNYEMRYPEQGDALVSRALSLATSAPEGPAYISLPREPLGADIPESAQQPARSRPAATPASPDPEAINQLASWLAEAERPVILCQRGDVDGRLSAALAGLAETHGIGVAEPFVVRNVMASDHPMFLGYDPAAAVADADLVIVLDTDIPWIERFHAPTEDVRIVHIGSDPHFARMPVRNYKTDLAIGSDPVRAIEALSAALKTDDGRAQKRKSRLEAEIAPRRQKMAELISKGADDPIGAEFLSRTLSQLMGDDAAVFSELGIVAGAMDLTGPNRLFMNVHAGGLGWAFPAALGAQLADRDRLCVACMGDGSYIFSNPVACHQISEALQLPVLVIIKNNGMWNAVRRSVVNAYKDGAAAKANTMPLTSLEPAPDYLQVAAASRAFTARVTHGSELRSALEAALDAIRTEKRQAVLDVRVAVSDSY